jgi:DNA-binding transcriptional ArsR family regulator
VLNEFHMGVEALSKQARRSVSAGWPRDPMLPRSAWRRLAILRELGVVSMRPEGNVRLYRLLLHPAQSVYWRSEAR